MTARALDEAAETIRQRALSALHQVPLAAGCAILLWLSLDRSTSLAVAFGGGVVFALLRAAWQLSSRRGLVARLALDPSAYAIPEVDAYGKTLVQPRKRAALATGIRTMIDGAVRPGSLYLRDRVLRHANELDAIARDLRSPSVRVHPATLARCRALLTEAAESPLYNAKLPEEDLQAVLRRIRADLHREV
jgi:hypothetical protein